MFFRAIYLFAKSLRRIATALEEANKLQRLDLAARGIIEVHESVIDPVEVLYGEVPD